MAEPAVPSRRSAMGNGEPCMSCGGNDGYGPAPHHEPGCYFAGLEDSGEPLGTCIVHGDYWTEDCLRCDWGKS